MLLILLLLGKAVATDNAKYFSSSSSNDEQGNNEQKNQRFDEIPLNKESIDNINQNEDDGQVSMDDILKLQREKQLQNKQHEIAKNEQKETHDTNTNHQSTQNEAKEQHQKEKSDGDFDPAEFNIPIIDPDEEDYDEELTPEKIKKLRKQKAKLGVQILPFGESFHHETKKNETVKEVYDEEAEYLDTIQFYPPDSEMYDEQKFNTCEGPNTIRSPDGSCKCSPGFEFGDPAAENGCWSYESKCHRDATCHYSGKCLCKNGFIGDGIHSCKKVVPSIKEIVPTKGRHIGGEQIRVFYKADSSTETISSIYCKFGQDIIEGQVETNDSALCITPRGEGDSNTDFQVSFSGNDWSNTVKFNFYNETTKIRRKVIYGSIVFIIVVILSLLKRRVTNNASGEQRPFLYVKE